MVFFSLRLEPLPHVDFASFIPKKTLIIKKNFKKFRKELKITKTKGMFVFKIKFIIRQIFFILLIVFEDSFLISILENKPNDEIGLPFLFPNKNRLPFKLKILFPFFCRLFFQT
jgi:hypothetical protein